MKHGFYLFLCWCLVIFAGCVPDEETTGENQNQYQQCDNEKSLCRPGVLPWNILISKEGFPAKTRLLINQKVVFDECEPNRVMFKVNRGNSLSTIELPGFMGISEKEQINLELRNLGSCYENELYYAKASQPFQIKTRKDKKLVWIEII